MLTLTIEIIELPNGDVAVGIKTPGQAGTAQEAKYFDNLNGVLREVVLPRLAEQMGTVAKQPIKTKTLPSAN